MSPNAAGCVVAPSPPVAEAELFVINLCASSTPLALAHPADPELKRHTFFVTRQREEGRERFRLHMGYFDTLAQAESLLGQVRDVYPAAWAGPAPTRGTPRRGRARPGPATGITPPPPPTPAASAMPVEAEPEETAAPVVPVLREEASPQGEVPVLAPLEEPEVPVLEAMSNVREVISQLAVEEDTAPPLSASQTLRILEDDSALRTAAMPLQDEVRLVTPEDTQTLRDIRLDAERNAPPCFAVQLLWSTVPIGTVDHPHLAIFDAYALYNVEGNRQGRKWYGLRLGFFTDPNAATQVATYIRSDYPSVAVVPVAEKERDRVRQGKAQPLAAARAPQAAPQPDGLGGLELLDDDRPAQAKQDVTDAPAPPASAAGTPVPKAAAPRKPGGKRVVARNAPARRIRRAADSLEHTLEVLGASTLSIDNSHETVKGSLVRNPVASGKKKKGSRLARLFGRLGNG